MSMPAGQRSEMLLHATRLQLEELDALIQRMLGIPVASFESVLDAAPAPAATTSAPSDQSERRSLGQASLAPAEHQQALGPVSDPHLMRGLSDQEVEPVPMMAADSIPPLVVPSEGAVRLMEVPTRAKESEPAAVLAPATLATMPFPAEENRALPHSAWLRPLMWANGAFDGCTVLLGPLGRWLRKPVGRAFLGGLGLVLLAAAAAWGLLDWMGWTW